MKLHRITALLLKYYYISINRVDRLFDIVYWPIIDIFVWGFASFYIASLSDVNILSMLIGGVILWMFVWHSCQDLAVFVLEDFWSRNLFHLFSSPVRINEHVASILLLGVIRSSLTFFVMSGLAGLLYAFSIFRLPILQLGASVAILSLFGFVIGLFITGMIFRFGQRIQILAWSVVWGIQPFSCVFYPLSTLPPWAASIARFLPTTQIFEAMRAAFSGAAVSIGSIVYALLTTIVLFIAMLLFLRSSFEHARKTGLLAKGD